MLMSPDNQPKKATNIVLDKAAESASEPLAETKPNSKEALAVLQKEIDGLILPLGYETVTVELVTAGGRALRIYIDFLESKETSNETSSNGPKLNERRIGLDDCIAVNRVIDELLEATPLITGAYNLEVSSPGVERPLRKPRDYARFKGHKLRVHTFRSLTAEELGNPGYWQKNQRQKNFVGWLQGLEADNIVVIVERTGRERSVERTGRERSIERTGRERADESIRIPLALVSKSNLEYVEPSSENQKEFII